MYDKLLSWALSEFNCQNSSSYRKLPVIQVQDICNGDDKNKKNFLNFISKQAPKYETFIIKFASHSVRKKKNWNFYLLLQEKDWKTSKFREIGVKKVRLSQFSQC